MVSRGAHGFLSFVFVNFCVFCALRKPLTFPLSLVYSTRIYLTFLLVSFLLALLSSTFFFKYTISCSSGDYATQSIISSRFNTCLCSTTYSFLYSSNKLFRH